MANQEHLYILKKGREAWDTWRQQHPDIQPDLSEAVLSKAGLIEADLSNTYFYGADLFNANLSRANLSGADLSRAYLGHASLSYANLGTANLYGTRLNDANLFQANLRGANLKHADFSDARLFEADLQGADLDSAHLSRADLRGAHLQNAHLCNANLYEADLTDADLTGADLSTANLIGARLVRTKLAGANLTNCKIHGISAWDVELEGATQESLIITLPDQPSLEVDNLEVAQFIYLLLKYEKLRDVLNSVMERGVLILGRFSDDGLELLQAIAAKLRGMEYLPIIFDFERPDSRNLTETVMTLVGLSRFVIVDLSGRSVPNELRSAVPHFKIPFVPIIEGRRKEEIYSMFSDFLEDDWVLPLVAFTNKEHLMKLLPSKVIGRAEKKCTERQKRLKNIFKH